MTASPEVEEARFRADPGLLDRLQPLLEELAASPASLSSVTDPGEARSVHLEDSLSGLAVPELATARLVADLGTGGGFPGLPLAAALPDTAFTLIDSVGRKVDFVAATADRLGLANVTAINTRSEDLARKEGREAFDLVTARAVAPLDALAELASPLLAEGGHLVAWKGDREPEGERALERIGDRVAMALRRVVAVRPYTGSRKRHLYVVGKTGPTPDGLPRRPGMVRKRPLAARNPSRGTKA